jgi:hypothetical protein
MLAALTRDLPDGRCRRLVLGSGNTLAILSSEADELWRGIGDRSGRGHRISVQRYASVRALVSFVRRILRGPAWASCAPGQRSRRLVFFRPARLRDSADESRSRAASDGDVGFDGGVV